MHHRRHRQTYEEKLQRLNKKLAARKNVNRGDPTIFTKQGLQEIAYELDDLKKKGHLAKHTLVKKEDMLRLDDTLTVRSVRRVVKLRFRCTNQKCPQFHKFSEQSRIWTSYYGLVDFKFYFKKVPHKNSTELFYSFLIYRQQCRECLQWGKSGLIASSFDLLISLYLLLLKQCLVKIRQRRQLEIVWDCDEKYGKRPQANGAFNGHLTKLCEACHLRVCLRFYEVQNQTDNTPDDFSGDSGDEENGYIVNNPITERQLR